MAPVLILSSITVAHASVLITFADLAMSPLRSTPFRLLSAAKHTPNKQTNKMVSYPTFILQEQTVYLSCLPQSTPHRPPPSLPPSQRPAFERFQPDRLTQGKAFSHDFENIHSFTYFARVVVVVAHRLNVIDPIAAEIVYYRLGVSVHSRGRHHSAQPTGRSNN